MDFITTSNNDYQWPFPKPIIGKYVELLIKIFEQCFLEDYNCNTPELTIKETKAYLKATEYY